MTSSSVYICVFTAVMVILVNSIFAVKTFKHKKRGSFLLGQSILIAAFVNTVYVASQFSSDEMMFSVLTSIYASCTDLMLLSLLGFSITINTEKFNLWSKITAFLSFVLVMLDILQFILNPSVQCSFSITERTDKWPRFEIAALTPYKLHFIFSFILVALVMIFLFNKSLRIPKEYRGSYRITVYAIAGIVVVNLFFYFHSIDIFLSRIDVSTLTYGFTTILVYWSFYEYSNSGMLKIFKTAIFEQSSRANVMFDFEKNLILTNRMSVELFGDEMLSSELKLDEFIEKNDIHLNRDIKGNQSFQMFFNKDEKLIPLRCDYKIISNKSDDVIGYLFMFTDGADETDLMTGFHNWENFRVFFTKNQEQFDKDQSIAILDINALSVFNQTFGHDEGDRKIKELSDLMRSHFPEGTYFIRGNDANLVAVCDNVTEDFMRSCVENLRAEFSIKSQYALNSTHKGSYDLITAIVDAENAMKTKKLQDESSSHSEILHTLVKALEECDQDTKQHVQRTKEIGARLGKRLGLSDVQLCNLSLLCLLHDIGKIGVPLGILNKQSKLTDDEWNIMKSHSEKGYQITASSKELSVIADMVRHHHERWDGNGYPDGLEGENIPLLSRMISVIDSYDAMVNDRIYRKAMSQEAAIAEMERCSGTQFDPNIVKEFINMLREEGSEINATVSTERSSVNIEEKTEDTDSEEAFVNVSPVFYAHFRLDDNMKIIFADENFYEITGYSAEDTENEKMSLLDLIPEEDRELYLYLVNEQLSNNPSAIFEHRVRKKNGDCIQVFCVGRLMEDAETGKLQSDIYFANIMQTRAVKTMHAVEQNKAKKRIKQWESQYRTDLLTGLMNKAAFKNEVDRLFYSSKNRVLFIMMDLKDFSGYNKKNGKDRGDELLVLVAQTISGLLRKKDYACRIGGDEFAAALIFGTDVNEDAIYTRGRHFYESVTATLKSSVDFSGITMGAALADETCSSFDTLHKETLKVLKEAEEKEIDDILFRSTNK